MWKPLPSYNFTLVMEFYSVQEGLTSQINRRSAVVREHCISIRILFITIVSFTISNN